VGGADTKAFLETARRFASREVAVMVGTEGRDGDLSRVSNLLDEAERIGLLASADPESAGYEFGVWGRASVDAGALDSVLILVELARACAGFAALVHFAGLAASELHDTDCTPRRAAVALFEDGWRLTEQGVFDPAAPPQEILTSIVEHGGDGFVLSGEKSFVFGPAGVDGYVVYARDDNGWARLFVPADASGLAVKGLGLRTGLAACPCVRLGLNGLSSSAVEVLPARGLSDLLCRLWLGLAAVALGNAEAALDVARKYAEERYQGCGEIRTHGAVRLLLGDAASRVIAARANLLSTAESPRAASGSARADALVAAASAKLRVVSDCLQAVTDCLQVFGGYGYMEDFRMEKRLRDALTLQSMCTRPDDLRLLISQFGEGVRHRG